MRGISGLIRRFARDEGGAFIVIFGVMAIVLVATAGAVVDYTTVEQSRSRAQEALDSAALGLQPTLSTVPTPTIAQLKARAQDLVTERLANDNVTAVVREAEVDAENTLTLEAEITVPTSFVSLVGVNSIRANVLSQVKKGGVNVEVAVALDVTGSMNLENRIGDLREATKELIDIVVQDQQTPYYSKIALVPYSMGVNVGSYANAIRGGVVGGTTITGADWRVSGTSRTISAITNANPARVTTSTSHGYSTGDTVYISGVNGMTQVNGGPYTITVISSSRFRLDGVNSTWWPSFSSWGSPTVVRCRTSDCEVEVTSSGHGLENGERVYVSGVNGMTQINTTSSTPPWIVANRTANSFVLQGSDGPAYSNYSSGGTAFCASHRPPPASGCQYLYFESASGRIVAWPYTFYSSMWNVFQISTCVSERTGTNAYTDAPPSTTHFGRNYAPAFLSQYGTSPNTTYNPCIPNQIVPLSTNKTNLRAIADSLVAGGSTAGHIGLAWAWYMVSPNFSYLWPADSQPAAYGTEDLVKAVVLMTDGEFNTVYRNGVIAQNSISGSGTGLFHINQDSLNGGSYHQANQSCAAMKAAGIIVYTVGFKIVDQEQATNLMANCATSPEYAFLAESGDELRDAFRAIGNSIAALRVSR